MTEAPAHKVKSFGTGPVFFTAISTILGAILFLRFGFAVGTLGYMGVFLIIILGHMVTIPTAMAISEIATNQKVEGGGEYFIISRSFGLNIGATIGISLFLSQAISVAFYVIAFTEAFEPAFNWVKESYGMNLPRQAVSLPAMGILSVLIITKGANLGVKALYVIVGLLFVALFLFFIGNAGYQADKSVPSLLFEFRDRQDFFLVFAIVFPAFTGMTAGVGLSGDLKDPGKSIPMGTLVATIIGMVIYVFVIWKLTISASPEDLVSEQLIMSRIAVFGFLIIPIGLAASTISSALGSVMVAPRTLQALAADRTFPVKVVNDFLAKGKGKTSEPLNASVVTCFIAFVFVALGDVNAVARIISMFFMVTYGALCLISFLYHFGSDPAYRPTFKSRWYISLLGFVMCVYLMFKMDSFYAIFAIIVMVLIYNLISYYKPHRRGLQFIFKGALFQVNRAIQVFLQKSTSVMAEQAWRPSVVCVSKDSFQREEAFYLLNWIAYKYGFGTYIHLMEGYYSRNTHKEADVILKKLIQKYGVKNDNVYIDTLISPSYTSAIAQIIQLPGISGMDNNMIMFEYSKEDPVNLPRIIDNIEMVRAGHDDILILASSHKRINFHEGIHIWIKPNENDNAILMILLSYIIVAHPDWKKEKIRIFLVVKSDEAEGVKQELIGMMKTGRIPISDKNIEVVIKDDKVSLKDTITLRSSEAGLAMMGFNVEHLKHEGEDLFKGYDKLGNILFVHASSRKEIY